MDPAQDRVPDPAVNRRPRVRRRLRTPLEARQWRRKVTGTALFVAAFILMVNAIVGENGYLATLRVKGDRDRLIRDVASVRQENQRLSEEVERLKNDSAALEEAARKKLNMIKPGETMVVIKEKPPKK